MTMLIFMLAQFALIAAITIAERSQNPGKTDWWRNLQVWALDLGTGFLLLPFFSDWAHISLLDGKAMPFWLACITLIFVRDGLEFGFHWIQHRVPFLWRMHSLHHSDPEMGALTTSRHFWGDKLVKALTIWPLTTVFISQTFPMIAVYSLISLYNYFIHANLRVNLGKWSWVINAPAYHRRHHSRLPEHYNSNYAALLPIFDVIFGSYNRPDGWPPTGQARAPKNFGELIIWPFLKAGQASPAEAAKLAVPQAVSEAADQPEPVAAAA